MLIRGRVNMNQTNDHKTKHPRVCIYVYSVCARLKPLPRPPYFYAACLASHSLCLFPQAWNLDQGLSRMVVVVPRST